MALALPKRHSNRFSIVEELMLELFPNRNWEHKELVDRESIDVDLTVKEIKNVPKDPLGLVAQNHRDLENSVKLTAKNDENILEQLF